MRNRLQAVRKAAILIASLDPQTADVLIEQMPPEQAAAVRAAIDTLGPVSPDEQQATIEEFFRIGPLVPEKSPPGIELDGETIDEWLPTVATRAIDEPTSFESSASAGLSWSAADSIVACASETPDEPMGRSVPLSGGNVER